MSLLTFLKREWAADFEAMTKVESAVHADPWNACCYHCRAFRGDL